MSKEEKTSMRARKAAGITRRDFVRYVGSVTTAATAMATGIGLPKNEALAALRTLRKPKVKIRQVKGTAAEIYQCKPELKRFHGKDLAFRVVTQELGAEAGSVAVANKAIENMHHGYIGHGVPVADPIEARMFLALNVAATTWNEIIGPYGENLENKGFRSWHPQGLPPELTSNPVPIDDSKEVTKKVKVMSAFAGADRAGVAKIDRRWVYASASKNAEEPGPDESKNIVFKAVDQPRETKTEFVLPESVQYAVVMIFVQPRAPMQVGPSTLATLASTNQGYSQMGIAAVALAQAIRSLGYVAIPCMNDTALSVPLAIDVGLGQLGRLGYLITPEFGPHVRIAKVLTNMPLTPDNPIDFGVTEYCTNCGICAEECPAGAICPDVERSYKATPAAAHTQNPGALKWYIDGRKCVRWWAESGSGCGYCMTVCPYTRITMGDWFGGEKPVPEKIWDMHFEAYGRRKIDY